MNMEKEIQRFKMEMLRKMPFYGDILMHLTFVEDKHVSVAATDGKTIWYNPASLSKLDRGKVYFILMHELFHVLLRHGVRNMDGTRDRDIWNAACDIIINDMLLRMRNQMRSADIPFEKPEIGIFATVSMGETAENLYSRILSDNLKENKNKKKLMIRYAYTSWGEPKFNETDIPSDIRSFDITPEEMESNDREICDIVKEAIKKEKDRGMGKSYFVPQELYTFIQGKKIDWRRLLKDFLSEEIGDDSSYTTPERKYLHMDLILPGHSLTEEKIEEIWAFVDSSGSVSKEEMSKFLTQLYYISRDFKCTFNICYWDTSVTDVYKKITSEEDIMKCLPKHTGGTNINCVYKWLSQNKVKPDIMLILTDGEFGRLTAPEFERSLGRKTILVLSTDILENDDMKKIGKIARL